MINMKFTNFISFPPSVLYSALFSHALLHMKRGEEDFNTASDYITLTSVFPITVTSCKVLHVEVLKKVPYLAGLSKPSYFLNMFE